MALTFPEFGKGVIEAVAKVLGATETGLSASQIGVILSECHIADPDSGLTKWRRLNTALWNEQVRLRSGKPVVEFIQKAMSPVRWLELPQRHLELRDRLNEALAFAGLQLTESGELKARAVATTIDEARKQQARRVFDEMVRRSGHPEIFKYCTAELVGEDCSGAVLEAVKGLCDRLRSMTGLDTDGQPLVDAAVGIGKNGPVLAFNRLETETERNEQRGLQNIMKGVTAAFRNPLSHTPRIRWDISEPDAIDLLSTISLLHRRLDTAVRLPTHSDATPLGERL